MKFRLRIENTKRYFKVKVLDLEGKLVHETGWKGGAFLYEGKHYMVLGPYYAIEPGELFRVWELVPASELT